jgi:hypothetical protein
VSRYLRSSGLVDNWNWGPADHRWLAERRREPGWRRRRDPGSDRARRRAAFGLCYRERICCTLRKRKSERGTRVPELEQMAFS